ncbi:glutaredoxin family protein [Alkalimarinus alittae]|uniref:Glutaredoxin family protein n=1 Tax=Alkalimarinus alittae TaxID=2961619 RepID=A0ABY6N619_9ALTE|nr:glutaredoxin family protein [Alkalimarinus alittae]UZE97571.1 glutaredoxin family protein [Alkalimarinus alittae]
MIELILYSTTGCHLCEQAVEVLQVALQGECCMLDEIDIANDDILLEQYGVRIPVLKNPQNGKEIGWPFEPNDVLLLLEP